MGWKGKFAGLGRLLRRIVGVGIGGVLWAVVTAVTGVGGEGRDRASATTFWLPGGVGRRPGVLIGKTGGIAGGQIRGCWLW